MKATIVFAQVEGNGEVTACLSALLQQFISRSVAAPAEIAAEIPPALPAAPEPIKRRGGRRKNIQADEQGATPVPESPRRMGRIEKLNKIEKFLSSVGSSTMAEISRACGIPTGSMTSYMQDPRFEKTEDGSYRVH